MLDYEWGNPPAIILTASAAAVEDATSPPDHQNNHHIFNPYLQTFNETTTNNTPYLDPNNFLNQTHNPTQAPTHFTSIYDPRTYYTYPLSPSPLLEPASSDGQTGFMPKTEPAGCAIGLNLGGRTYFSSAEDDFVNRLYCRSRPVEAGFVNSPRCQAEGCNSDLTLAKHYHRRHKVCEFHSKASTVIAAGLTQRFCQQCSRFHLLSEFDNGKRSCRRRLADHNRRRRKSSQNQDHSKSLITVTSTRSSSSDITSRYESDSRG